MAKTYSELKEQLNEVGEAAGQLELVDTSLEKARKFAEKVFRENGRNLDEEIPNFDSNYKKAQEVAGTGRTKRKDMPVIEVEDIKAFQGRLKSGNLDTRKPFSDHDYAGGDPFPEGLSGDEASKWLKSGLKDGKLKDDIVKAEMQIVPIGSLKPIQEQIYFDKSISAIAENGADGTKYFMSDISILVVSNDDFIIDGHHRMLSGLLIGSNTDAQILRVNLPIQKLLDLSRSYADAIGNQRNQ